MVGLLISSLLPIKTVSHIAPWGPLPICHIPPVPRNFYSWAPPVGICISTGVWGNRPGEFRNKHGDFSRMLAVLIALEI